MALGWTGQARQVENLREMGYAVARAFLPAEALSRLNQAARVQLAARSAPLEYEADLQYPGAPRSHSEPGGETVRRLLEAYGRDREFAQWATAPRLRRWMESYFGEEVLMSRAHHNCLMTKHPRYGSMTGWHRDMRFWAFERDDLVSVWFALGEERVDNGALWLVPGSHAMDFDASRFGEAKFFRDDLAANAEILGAATAVHLSPGDALFFHCNTLHSAGMNLSDEVKFSLVYTYHARSNAPTSGTRSAAKPEILLGDRDNRDG